MLPPNKAVGYVIYMGGSGKKKVVVKHQEAKNKEEM